MTFLDYGYIFFVILELFFLIISSVYILFLIYSWLKGAPFVGTRHDELDDIIAHADIHDNDRIIELGSGDGRFLRSVSQRYQISGLGVDINPFPVYFARFLTYVSHRKGLKFLIQDVRKTDISDADIIYIFLFPKLINSLQEKLIGITSKNVKIISHGFAVSYLKPYLIKVISGVKFKTYYYRISHPGQVC